MGESQFSDFSRRQAHPQNEGFKWHKRLWNRFQTLECSSKVILPGRMTIIPEYTFLCCTGLTIHAAANSATGAVRQGERHQV